jgi:hypothetical protein
MPSLLQSRYSTYVTWVPKKPGPLTTNLSNMEEVDAFLAPVKVLYLCNMGAQEIRTSDNNSLQYGGGGCSSQGTVLYLCNMSGQVIRTDHPSAAGPFTLCLVYPLLKLWLKNSL